MEDLPLDMLVNICDRLKRSNLRNLRLVDKRFHSAVAQSAINLRARRSLTPCQLLELGRLFRNCSMLSLHGCDLLSNERLRGVAHLCPRLRILHLGECTWLTAEGISHLANLPQLKSIDVRRCTGLVTLPDNISNFGSLQHINCMQCTSLRSLPEGISGLVSLHTLELYGTASLEGLPCSIGTLSLLRRLSLSGPRSLTELPNSISGLISLESLQVPDCRQLTSLPTAIASLSSLTELQLALCKSLETLPES